MLDTVVTLPLKDSSLLRQANLLDGRWIGADDGKTTPVTNPATGGVIGTIPAMGTAETRRAIEAAHRAQPAWRGLLAKERSAILRRLFNLMMENQDDLAVIMTAEQGKPLAESRGEIALCRKLHRMVRGGGQARLWRYRSPRTCTGRRILVTKEPIGVFRRHHALELSGGDDHPESGSRLGRRLHRRHSPGNRDALLGARAWRAGGAGRNAARCVQRADWPRPRHGRGTHIANPLVRKLSFTGSTEVGALLLAQCAPTIKKTSMELGGNAPFIVFDDADLDAAVTGAMISKFRNTGQTCVCANRILVQDGVFDAFAEKLRVAVEALQVSDGMEAGATQGSAHQQGGGREG